MNYNSSKNQIIIGKLVDREVVQNVSCLVSELIKNVEYMDELINICQKLDYQGAVDSDKTLTVFYDEETDTYAWVSKEEGEDDIIFDDFETEEEACQDCCESNDLDVQNIEALEHWIVADWLAEKLAQEGGMVVYDFLGLTIWGRTGSGQAILSDHVFGKIAEGMEILDGQKNEWRNK